MSSMVSVFGFVNGSYCFFGIRTSQPPSRRPRRIPPARGTSGSGSGSTCFVSGIFSAPRVPSRQCGGQVPSKSGSCEISGSLQLVLVARGHVHHAGRSAPPRRAAPSPASLPPRPRSRACRLARRSRLRVDVPKDRSTHARDFTGQVPVSDTKTGPPEPCPTLRLVSGRSFSATLDNRACPSSRPCARRSPRLGEGDRELAVFHRRARPREMDSPPRAGCRRPCVEGAGLLRDGDARSRARRYTRPRR